MAKEPVDESNYPYIEEFVKGLKHPHETSHALYHSAKKYVEENGSTGTTPSSTEQTGDAEDFDDGQTKPVSIDDYKRLKKEPL